MSLRSFGTKVSLRNLRTRLLSDRFFYFPHLFVLLDASGPRAWLLTDCQLFWFIGALCHIISTVNRYAFSF